jgi:uncharacterized phage protein (TIGR02218 family)
MKSANPELIELLTSKRQFACADLFTITRWNGDVLRISNTDVPIYWNNEIFSCYGIQPSGVRYRIVTGLEADEQTLVLACDRTIMMDNQPFLDAISNGSLDGARIKRERAYFETWAEPGAHGLAPVGCLTLFSGFVSTVDNVSRTEAELKVKSNLALLDVNMPISTWQASCINTVFKGLCKLSKEAYGVTGAAGSGASNILIPWSGATAAYFWKGTVAFTTGANAGQIRTIKNSDGSGLLLASPLPYAPGAGDEFIAYPGCDHTMFACEHKFGNLVNFRGTPYIPTSEMAL